MTKHQVTLSLKRFAFLALVISTLLISSTFAASAPVVVGDWEGAINSGNASLRVVIHVAQDDHGKLTATMDSPDQGASGIAISTISFNHPDLHFEIERFGCRYDGKIDKDNSVIAGEWKQGGASLPLTFKRTAK